METNESARNSAVLQGLHLVIDIGNTIAKAAVFRDDLLIDVLRTSNTTLQGLSQWANDYGCVRGILSTVVTLTQEAQSEIATLPFELLQLSGLPKLPITSAYQLQKIGTDRIAALAGVNSSNILTLVVDLGTCITYDVLCKQHHIGGNISPGISMRLSAMKHYTSRLPLVEPEGEYSDLGLSTEEALRAGVLRGVYYEIAGYISQKIAGEAITDVVVTGGDAHFFEKALSTWNLNAVNAKLDYELVLKGLNRILIYNGTY